MAFLQRRGMPFPVGMDVPGWVELDLDRLVQPVSDVGRHTRAAKAHRGPGPIAPRREGGRL